MKITRFLSIALLIFSFSGLWAQEEKLPELKLEKSEVEAHLRFLASDALKGRRTGEEGNNIAAAYLAAYFEAHGLQYAPGLNSYFQPVILEGVKPAGTGSLAIEDQVFEQQKNLLMTRGGNTNLEGKVVFAGHGWVDEESGHDDYKKLNVKGKIVIVLPGTPESQDRLAIFRSMSVKRELAAERGAIALIELYQMRFPWEFFLRFFGRESLGLASGDEDTPGSVLPYGWLKPDNVDDFVADLKKSKKSKGNLKYPGTAIRKVPSQNVVGIIEGTDPQLKEEYVLITAHYDHVGTGKNGGGNYSEQDSIFNGARDNGMGTVALMSAAKALSVKKPKRSVIVCAVTAEEIGLLGSAYYAENPVVPLEKTIFNLNTDGAGYNDVSYLSVVGFGRTGTDELIEAAAEVNGLKVFPDPAPEQNLFDRSDNVSFARKGVPALCVSPGTTGFDETIQKYYHQVTDYPDTIDYDYFIKYCRSFAHFARLISDWDKRPMWKSGDKYEAAGKELYERP